MYLLPSNVQSGQIIPIPKIIYRVIEAEYFDVWHAAIVVIHNDPNPIESDRICEEWETLRGWETIENYDHYFGLTYVCPCSYSIKEVNNKLGFQVDKGELVKPLELHRMYYYSHNDWDSGCVRDDFDATRQINSEYYRYT